MATATERWNRHIRQHENQVFLVLTLLIGAIVGLVVVAFILITERLGSRMYPPDGAPWRRLIVPVVGALGTGYLLQRYFPNARGSGIPQTKVALFVHNGRIRWRTVVGKFLCSSTSLASGIALGREGPSVQIGAGIASNIGRRLGLGPAKLRALIPVGTSAALAAAFNTPIAAVLFSLEEIMGDLHAPVLGSIVLSSATSWMFLHLVLGDEPLFHVPAYRLVSPVELAVYAGLGLAGGVCSVAFVRLTLGMRALFLRMPKWTKYIQPAFGGVVVGILGWFVAPVLGVGYDYVGQALNGQIALQMMALLVVLKLVATASCYASGNAGGIFGPSLFLGAMLGGATGSIAHHFWPLHTGTPGAYALVGMGATFAGIIRTPLTSVFMIFEITRDYSIIVPLMISNLISFYISYRLQRVPIYEALADQDGIHLPTAETRNRQGQLRVAQAMQVNPVTYPPEINVQELLEKSNATAFLIANGRALWGLLRRAEAQAAPRDATAGSVVATAPDRMRELAAASFPHVHADHSLDLALQRMGEERLDVLPVVDRANVRLLKGTVRLEDVMRAYGVAPTAPARSPDEA